MSKATDADRKFSTPVHAKQFLQLTNLGRKQLESGFPNKKKCHEKLIDFIVKSSKVRGTLGEQILTQVVIFFRKH